MNKLNQAEMESALTALGWRCEAGMWVHPRRDRKFACPSSAILLELRMAHNRAIRANVALEQQRTYSSTMFMLLAIAIAAAAVFAVMLYS